MRADGTELDEFLASLATQVLTDVECIFAVIGSDALQLRVAEAVDDRGIRATVLQASVPDASTARREALARAAGDWVTFPNARDVLGRNYVEALVGEITEHGESVDAIAVPGRSLSSTAAWVEPHPGRTVALDATLNGLTGDVSRLALRRSPVGPAGETTDQYYDELLVIDLLEHRGAPTAVRFVGGTLYLRRPLPPLDAQTARLRGDAARYLALLDEIARRLPDSPAQTSWKHWYSLRTISRLLAFENTTVRRATSLRGADGARFRAAFRDVLALFDDQLFSSHAERADAADERRDMLLALKGRTGVAAAAHIVGVDADAALMQVRHTRWSPTSTEELQTDGAPAEPVYGKRRAVEAFGSTIYQERIVWIPIHGRHSLRVDGVDVAILLADGEAPAVPDDPHAFAAQVEDHLRPGSAVGAAPETPGRQGWRAALRQARRSWLSRAAVVRGLARVPGVASGFDDAWLLMDRANMGRDNAEHMYRWLMEHHPEVNAWFVLRSDSPDFARLKAEGFRLVPYGSLRHQLLLNKTTQYLSSHVGIDVSRPIFDRYLLRHAPWTFTFLQHGVIHNDLSIWLNRQKMRLFITSTPQEHEAIAGDDSPYVFTDREARMTGLPRFDSLRRIADAAPVEKRRSIVIAPTWRNGLFEPPTASGELRKPKAGFRDSPFIRSILGVLGDDRLRSLAQRGYTVTFVPHPNLAEHFPYDAIPDHVEVTTYDKADVQELIGNAAVFLTDYSSVAFDAAFAEARVVYMHIDGGAVYGITHTLYPGYFDFERDGFGPVCTTADAAMQAIDDAVAGRTPHLYRKRVRDTFPYWDQGACARVFDAAITDLNLRIGEPDRRPGEYSIT
ncbi:hypothetical protein LK09_02065 [Microbacterium mangrovi]|uniref:Glycosyltransferase 2-like domain-containing protein n=1 Tax=Microbacterium mangrovi TaxID=1348253 RepID=A0A0B2A7H6_9MICO|nr:hypothetical protein LK09_02065 [Microbacterium mangrovi]